MGKVYAPTSSGDGEIIKCEIKRILTEEELEKLRALPHVSIGVIVAIPRITEKKEVEFLTINERNKKDTMSKTKLPSGGMQFGEHPFAAGIREVLTETGHQIDMKDIMFACGAEYSSTTKGETHYKIFLIATDATPVSEPIQDGFDLIESVNWLPLKELEEKIPRGQKTGLQPIMDKLVLLNNVYGFALMNYKARIPFMEGVYDTWTKPSRF